MMKYIVYVTLFLAAIGTANLVRTVIKLEKKYADKEKSYEN